MTGGPVRAVLLALVLALAVGALWSGVQRAGTASPVAAGTPSGAPGGPPSPAPENPAALAALQGRAALTPCPVGLGPQLPDLVLPCLGGGSDVRLRGAVPGRPTLVNLWASWCAPCVEEVPRLRAFSARAGDRVGLVGVLTTDSRSSALTFAAQYGMRWPSLVDDDGRVLRSFQPGLPLTLFLDATGRVVYRKSGAFRSEAELEQLVADHLGVRL